VFGSEFGLGIPHKATSLTGLVVQRTSWANFFQPNAKSFSTSLATELQCTAFKVEIQCFSTQKAGAKCWFRLCMHCGNFQTYWEASAPTQKSAARCFAALKLCFFQILIIPLEFSSSESCYCGANLDAVSFESPGVLA
jgi:hypothetical protein